ncbi:hypothetical protein M407DRAFT_17583 [Tulasnella calospora MUT 4182]|uniref:F-box domain-containing protein n=1 Tax=Tulasnella calospora MUT 4182 TaxID=1051891 RepID=A0A0C3MIW3_9AGAM|nr:hypothetical protein M407DRAFT_17583 [Tulasnella calospora MUT 4182]
MESGSLSVQPSSVFSLPPEIVAVILHLVTSNNRVLGRRYDDLIRTTLSTSYVRQVALATPSLWTRVEITDNPASFELAKACLNRSGSQKLDIAIRMAIRVGPKLPGVFALVNHVASRTRELQLQIGLGQSIQRDQLNRFLETLELPALECLQLDFWDPTETWLPTHPVPLPAGAAGLRSVSLAHLRPILPAPAIRLLKHLSMSSAAFYKLPLNDLLDILAQSEHLETLELIGEGTTDVVRARLPPNNRGQRAVVTPKLRRLTIAGLDSGSLAHVLLGLEASNLEEVSLVILGFKDTWSARYLWINSITIRPIPSVSKLDISFLPRVQSGDVTVTPPFPKFLHDTFPNIEHLSLARGQASSLLPFWTDIWEDPNTLPGASCWPFLRRLTLSGSDECELACIEKLQICRRFLTVRAKRALPTLEDVSLDVCPDTKKNPQFELWMDDVHRLLNKDAP